MMAERRYDFSSWSELGHLTSLVHDLWFSVKDLEAGFPGHCVSLWLHNQVPRRRIVATRRNESAKGLLTICSMLELRLSDSEGIEYYDINEIVAVGENQLSIITGCPLELLITVRKLDIHLILP